MSVMWAVEEPGKYYLQHYRISIEDGGAPNGTRQFQYKDGSLTPEGRIRYGVGKRRKRRKTPEEKERESYKQKVETAKARAKAKLEMAKINAKTQKKLNKIDYKLSEELRKNNSKAQAKALIAEAKLRLAESKKRMNEVKGISDEELMTRINRLNKEKQYQQLVKEQKEQEASPFKKWASKILTDSATRLATQTVNALTDKMVEKVKKKIDQKFGEKVKTPTLDELKKMDLGKMNLSKIQDLIGNVNIENINKIRNLQDDLKKKADEGSSKSKSPTLEDLKKTDMSKMSLDDLSKMIGKTNLDDVKKIRDLQDNLRSNVTSKDRKAMEEVLKKANFNDKPISDEELANAANISEEAARKWRDSLPPDKRGRRSEDDVRTQLNNGDKHKIDNALKDSIRNRTAVTDAELAQQLHVSEDAVREYRDSLRENRRGYRTPPGNPPDNPPDNGVDGDRNNPPNNDDDSNRNDNPPNNGGDDDNNRNDNSPQPRPNNDDNRNNRRGSLPPDDVIRQVNDLPDGVKTSIRQIRANLIEKGKSSAEIIETIARRKHLPEEVVEMFLSTQFAG